MRDELKADMEEFALGVGREQWERRQERKDMERRVTRLLSKYQPQRATKHPKEATKSSVASRKAKNRQRRKANRRTR